jgi:hypothetical protein
MIKLVNKYDTIHSSSVCLNTCPENHTRSLSSSLKVVEKSLLELKEMLTRESNSYCTLLMKDINDETLKVDFSAIQEGKEMHLQSG